MWQETSNNDLAVNARMTDVVFRINCPRLPIDHAAALANAVCEHAPHIKTSKRAGIHPIHVAGSQNGWERPDHHEGHLLLSKRTRFRIRTDVDNAKPLIQALSEVTLDVDGFTLDILSGQAKPLAPAQTLFSRYMYFKDLENDPNEVAFEECIIEQCREFNFSPTKILCGKEHTINTAHGPQHTRSVLLADVPVLTSVRLQENGLGDGRTIGCGLFIAHKGTGAVNEGQG